MGGCRRQAWSRIDDRFLLAWRLQLVSGARFPAPGHRPLAICGGDGRSQARPPSVRGHPVRRRRGLARRERLERQVKTVGDLALANLTEQKSAVSPALAPDVFETSLCRCDFMLAAARDLVFAWGCPSYLTRAGKPVRGKDLSARFCILGGAHGPSRSRRDG